MELIKLEYINFWMILIKRYYKKLDSINLSKKELIIFYINYLIKTPSISTI